jgi:S-adenosylmethionine-diacylglycerol 3-amino-3-carboxypropyl transferase
MRRDALTLMDRIDQKVFDAIYARSLVYNTCWEDPAVDREALAIQPDDVMLVITSAGCNVLDYALSGPRRIHAVDANPRQTALLELKLAAIRHLQHPDFFALFGEGRHARFAELYRDGLRADLSPFAQTWWDRRLHWFMHAEDRGSFYFHGLSGLVARGFRSYLHWRPEARRAIEDMIAAPDLQTQRDVYESALRPRLWNGATRWVLSRQLTLSLLGVPHPQRREVQAQHADGVAGYVAGAIDYVARNFPLATNHFWRVYLTGRYAPGCSPRYLEPTGFARLKAGLADRIAPHTCTVTDFLRHAPEAPSKIVLLDHMDWMSGCHPEALAEEWSLLLDRARPGARAIFRSANARPHYLDGIPVQHGRERKPLRDLLVFHHERARALTRQDRVHTYAGFHIADLPGARA